MMAACSFVLTLVFIAVGFAVGLRLLALYRRTHGLAEFTLGLGLFLIVGLGYPVMLVALATAGAPLGAWTRVLLSLANTLMTVGWMAVWVFTWRVFRPDSRPARVGASGAILALGVVLALRIAATASARDLVQLGEARLANLGTPLLAIGSYVWTAVEAFRYAAMLRKRAALGIGDVVVANRFALWGCVGLFSMLSMVPSVIRQLEGASSLDALTQLLAAIAGLACSVVLYLAFLPPKAYVSWLRQGAFPQS